MPKTQNLNFPHLGTFLSHDMVTIMSFPPFCVQRVEMRGECPFI